MKPFFLVTDTTLASRNRLCFRKNLLERIQKLVKTIDDKIRDENLWYDITKDAAKRLLSSGKIDKYEYLTDEDILPSDQSRVINKS